MKKLLNTLYITTPNSYLSLDGETVVINIDDQDKSRIPLLALESIVAFSYAGASPALMGECAKRNISLVFMTASGRFLARVVGKEYGNVFLRRQQYRIADSEKESCDIAKNMIAGKLFNARWILERGLRDHPMRIDCEKMKTASLQIHTILQDIPSCCSLDTLRGLEGSAATIYFNVLDDLILQQKDHFYFHIRSRRPPMDNFNAILSFIYTLLANDIASACSSVGLDPYVGFLHRDRPGRISLALDVMEELRPILADRLAITLINKKLINSKGFYKHENGAIRMDDETRKSIISAWQERKREIITHPFLKEKIQWGLVPYVQVMLLARFIRGDLDAYPPFFWK